MIINQRTERSELLEKLMRLTTARPEKLFVSETEMAEKAIFTVACDDRDYGRIVGKSGTNVLAWSTLADGICQHALQKPAEVIVSEPESRNVHPPDKYEHNPNWGEENLRPLLKETAAALFDRGVVEVKSAGTILVANITVHDDQIPFDEFKLTPALIRVFRAVGGSVGRRIELEVVFRSDNTSKPKWSFQNVSGNR